MELRYFGPARRAALTAAHFVLGGLAYAALEVAWRGFTHPSMFVAGGAGVLLLIRLSRSDLSYPRKCLAGALMLTGVEFGSGCVVNLWLKWSVWDYSDMRVHLLGQICPIYFIIWGLLCAVMLPLFARLERWESRRFANRLPSDGESARRIPPEGWPDAS